MRRQSKSSLMVLGCIVPLSLGPSAPAGRFDVQPESRIWVRGTSTMRAFECRTTAFESTVESSGPGAAAAVLAGEKAVGAVDITVPTERLECGNGTMNGHMRKAIKAQENPQITFHLQSYELVKSNDSVQVTLDGTLTIGGVKKPAAIKATAMSSESGALRVTGTYTMRMSEYGLKPPSLMFGTMKVGDQLKIGFDVLLKDSTE